MHLLNPHFHPLQPQRAEVHFLFFPSLYLQYHIIEVHVLFLPSLYVQYHIIEVHVLFFPSLYLQYHIIEVHFLWCYGNASTRKRLNTEMPQKKAETPQKPVFLRRFRNFCKKNGNPSKPSF